MRILVAMSDEASPLGYLEEPVQAYGAEARIVRPVQGEKLPPDDEGFDGLVVLGGDMHAENDDEYPHLKRVVRLILSFHVRRKPVLGVCLGAQLVARAFGARVRRHKGSECGLYPIRLTPEGARDPLIGDQPSPVHLIQYHEDAFDMPAGAIRLMETDTWPNQALRMGTTTYGFQMHFEASSAMMESWIEATRDYVDAAYPGLALGFPAEMAEHEAEARKFAADVGFGWFKMVKRRADHDQAINASLGFEDGY